LTSKKKPKNPSICLVTETPGQSDNQAIDSITQAQQTRKSNRELPIELYVDASSTSIRVKSHLISTIFLKQGTSIYVHSHSSIWFHIFHSPEKQEMCNMSANTAGWKTATEGTLQEQLQLDHSPILTVIFHICDAFKNGKPTENGNS
jgi:hypothetical protein